MKDDLISRQAAINALGEEPEVWTGADDEVAARGQWRIDKAAIEAAPTAEKRGKWISHEGYEECSQCGKFTVCYSKFCPNCGARMTEDNKE